MTNTNNDHDRVFDVASGQEILHMTHNGPVSSLTFSGDARYIATGSDDKTARVLEVARGKEMLRLTHEGPVYSVAFSQNGNYVFTGTLPPSRYSLVQYIANRDSVARVFTMPEGKERRLTYERAVEAVEFTGAELGLVTLSEDCTLRAL